MKKSNRAILILLLSGIILFILIFSYFRTRWIENAEGNSPSQLSSPSSPSPSSPSPSPSSPASNVSYCQTPAGVNDVVCKLNESPTDSSPGLNSSEIISLTYKAVKLWPDDYSALLQNVLNEINSTMSIYYADGEILRRDASNVAYAKNKLTPMTTAINKGSMSAGVNSADRLDQIKAISKETGTNLYTSVENNTVFTKLYTKYKLEESIDTAISKFLNDLQATSSSYFNTINNIQNKYKNICEGLDVKYYLSLGENPNANSKIARRQAAQNATPMQIKLMNQYKLVRNNVDLFDPKMDILNTLKNGGVNKLLGLNKTALDPSDLSNVSDGIIYHMTNIKNAWIMWENFCYRESRYLIDVSYSYLTDDWKSQSKTFKDNFATWMDFEIWLSDNINNLYFKGGDINGIIKILSDVQKDNYYASLQNSYNGLIILKDY